MKGATAGILKHLLLIGLLIASFLNTFSMHYNYPFPLHHDEWQHLALSMQASEMGYNNQFNPYLGLPNPHMDLEAGFHLFVSAFFLMSGLDPILNYQYLASIFSVIASLTIFLCVSRITKKYFVGIVSVMVFISLKSNVNILGKAYFVPLTMAMPFIFMYILFFVECLREKNIKKFSISAFLLLLLFLIHPPSFIILLIPSFIEMLFNLEFLNKIKKISRYKLLAASFVVCLIGVISVLLVWKGDIAGTFSYLSDLLFFERGWGKLEITFFIPLLYGMVNTFLLIIGFMKAFKTHLRFFISFAFMSLAITTLFNLTGITLLVPYSRAIHYSLLSMIPLTALGLYYALDYIAGLLKLKDSGTSAFVLNSTLTLIFFVIILNSTYALDTKYRFYDTVLMSDSDYNTLLWVRQNYGDNNILLTPYFLSSAVYPVSKNKVVSLIPAQMEGGLMQDNLNFFNYDCTKQKEIIDVSGADYIISRTRMDCPYLQQQVFLGDYVYKEI